MKCKVIKAFDYAHEGVANAHLAVGDEAEIRDELVAGLADAGFIEKLKKGSPAPAPEKAPDKAAAPAPEKAPDKAAASAPEKAAETPPAGK